MLSLLPVIGSAYSRLSAAADRIKVRSLYGRGSVFMETKQTIQVRGFIQLDALFRKRNWPTPLILDLTEPISGADLAKKLDIPLKDVEIIFINGLAKSLDDLIHPGDRVAFVPPGCPGPYRIHLGFYPKHQTNI